MKETLTSRQRVIRAIERRPVDRMPIDFGCHFSTGISIFAYRDLRRALGFSDDRIELVDCGQLLARVDEDVLDRFHVDTVLLNPPFPRTRVWRPRGDYEFVVPERFVPELAADGAWVFAEGGRMPAGGYFFDGGLPDFYGLDEGARLALFARRAERLYKETDRFTMLMGFPAYFDGMDFACDMLTDPEGCMAYNERRLGEQIERFDRVNEAMGRYLGALEVNSDLGMQTGPMCTPDSYEQCCLPYLKRFCAHVHETSDVKVFMHCCGSIPQLMGYICDAGVDAINPVQISAAGMDPAELKRVYGDRICFWGGGCDTQHVLGNAGPEEIWAHVTGLIDVFAPGSGYVFNQVHNVMGNVPAENIIAMYDAAYSAAGRMGDSVPPTEPPWG